MTYQNYQQAQQKAEDPRQTEYRAMGLVTGKLIDARDSGDKRKLVEAVHLNEKLWSLFRCDLSQPGNGLPVDLRARLISISLWVQRHSSKVVKGEGDLEALIDVNRNIMGGLQSASAEGGNASSAGGGAMPSMPARGI